jgi:hypothetical protein
MATSSHIPTTSYNEQQQPLTTLSSQSLQRQTGETWGYQRQS